MKDVRQIGEGPCDSSACIRVDATGPIVRIESTETGEAMHATHEEWEAFLAGVKRGEFDVGAAN